MYQPPEAGFQRCPGDLGCCPYGVHTARCMTDMATPDSLNRAGDFSISTDGVVAALPARPLMQLRVDALGQRPRHAGHARKVVDARGLHAFESAEVREQRLSSLGPD